MFFTAMWEMMQYGLQRLGLVRQVEGFDYLEYAEATFEAMRHYPDWRRNECP